ncbi:probable polygalacturonase [Triticum dicoccoides]|uniref:probable polygalacturonase n=1 Tax=Triticum dicoccoides TaxID=85692 RepID=UPI00188FCED1|nr:probable polygalacturonase [Triticum dicoccoides]
MANITAEMTKERKVSWNCADVEGVSAGVTPAPCALLQGSHAGSCPFPIDTLAVDQIAVQQCSYSVARKFGKLKHIHGVFISDVTLVNSPAWSIHPVGAHQVTNTDVINPDLCSQVRIEDCYGVSGHDCVAIKSGWDEYGIAVGMPSKHIILRRLACVCVSPTSAIIALGSRLSGGIQEVCAEDITLVGTAVGRGAYVRDVYARRMRLDGMKRIFLMTGYYKSHPDDRYDKTAVPAVENINYQDLVATGVWKEAVRMQVIQGAPFKGVCMANATAEITNVRKVSWNCANVEGVSAGVTPAPCTPLQGTHGGSCPFPTDTLAVDQITVQQCSYSIAPASSVPGTE